MDIDVGIDADFCDFLPPFDFIIKTSQKATSCVSVTTYVRDNIDFKTRLILNKKIYYNNLICYFYFIVFLLAKYHTFN